MRLSIPTPTTSAVEIGPLTVHFYALCIIAAIAVAIWVADKRFTSAHSGVAGIVGDIAVIAVPSGVIGGRLYHVVTSPENYFGSNGSIFNVIKIWEGGLGIWGAISLGTVGAWVGYRQLLKSKPHLPTFGAFLDALAPGVVLAQAVGRWGNFVNQEAFGGETTEAFLREVLHLPNFIVEGMNVSGVYHHPTFLYESVWNIIGFLIMIFILILKQLLIHN